MVRTVDVSGNSGWTMQSVLLAINSVLLEEAVGTRQAVRGFERAGFCLLPAVVAGRNQGAERHAGVSVCGGGFCPVVSSDTEPESGSGTSGAGMHLAGWAVGTRVPEVGRGKAEGSAARGTGYLETGD